MCLLENLSYIFRVNNFGINRFIIETVTIFFIPVKTENL